MIRILIAAKLSPMIIEQLNEITEFEILEKTALTARQLADESKNIEALVVDDSAPPALASLPDTINLKIIITVGSGLDRTNAAAARQKNIEVRSASAVNAAGAESPEVISVLKDFFNV